MRVRLAMACASLLLLSRPAIGSPPASERERSEPTPDRNESRVPEWLKPGDEVEQEDARVIVVSTGTRTERDAATTPVATDVVTRDEIVGSGAENLADALEESGASLQTSTSFNGTSLRLRGLDPQQVLIVVDGQRVTGRIDGAIDLRRFTIENVERIEIVKGAGSVLYGSDAIGGVVNIVTRPPEQGVQAEAHGSYGSRNTLDLSGRVAGGGRHWGLAAFGGLHRTDGWDADTSNATTTGDRLSQWNVGANARFDVRGNVRGSLSADYLNRDARGVSETETGAILDRRNLSETTNTTARVEWQTPDSRLAFTLHHNLFRDQFRQDQRDDTALDQYQPTFDHIGQLGVQLDQVAGRHVVTSGFEAQLEWLTTTRVIADNGGTSVERQRIALFVQDEWTPIRAPRISLLPSLRFDLDSRSGAYPTGRLAMLVQPHETLTLRVGYGRGYRAPSFREMYLAFTNAGVGYRVAGNSTLRPEQAWTLDLAATWTPKEFVHVSAGVFDNRLRDLVTTDRVSLADGDGLEVFGYVNVGSAYTRGVEASAGVEFLKHFALTGSYTLLDARDLVTGRRLPGRSTHQGTLSLEFHQRRWGTRLFARVGASSRRPYTEDEMQVFSEPFATVDVRLSQSLLRYLTLFIGAENLLDAGNAILIPLPPRSFYGGLTFRY